MLLLNVVIPAKHLSKLGRDLNNAPGNPEDKVSWPTILSLALSLICRCSLSFSLSVCAFGLVLCRGRTHPKFIPSISTHTFDFTPDIMFGCHYLSEWLIFSLYWVVEQLTVTEALAPLLMIALPVSLRKLTFYVPVERSVCESCEQICVFVREFL